MAVVFAFLLLAVFLILQVSPALNLVTFDESNLVYDAARMDRGAVPYRDYFDFVPPVTLYLLASSQSVSPGRPETAERYLVIAAVFLTGLICFAALVGLGWSRLEAVVFPAVFIVCLYAFSPFAPHHWFADVFLMLCAACSLVLIHRGRADSFWFCPGMAAGLALCTLQTSGCFAVLFLVLVLGMAGGGCRTVLRRGLWAALGFGAASAVCLGPLLALNGGKNLWRDLVVWPLKNYDRPGNPNDVPFLADLPGRLRDLWQWPEHGSAGHILGALSGTILYAGILAVAAATLAASVWVLYRLARKKRPALPALAAGLLTPFMLAVFAHANATWVHLAYALPFILFLWLCAIPPGTGSPLKRRVVVLMLVLLSAGVLYRGFLLFQHPPALWQVTDVDRVDRDSPLNRSLRNWALLKPGDSIVVIPTGGSVYLYTYPAAIGYTYFFPLRDHYNDLEDHMVVARQIARNKPAAILIDRPSYQAFLDPRSPVARILETHYHRVTQTPAVIVLARDKPAHSNSP